jgi:hypothetical protein
MITRPFSYIIISCFLCLSFYPLFGYAQNTYNLVNSSPTNDAKNVPVSISEFWFQFDRKIEDTDKPKIFNAKLKLSDLTAKYTSDDVMKFLNLILQINEQDNLLTIQKLADEKIIDYLLDETGKLTIKRGENLGNYGWNPEYSHEYKIELKSEIIKDKDGKDNPSITFTTAPQLTTKVTFNPEKITLGEEVNITVTVENKGDIEAISVIPRLSFEDGTPLNITWTPEKTDIGVNGTIEFTGKYTPQKNGKDIKFNCSVRWTDVVGDKTSSPIDATLIILTDIDNRPPEIIRLDPYNKDTFTMFFGIYDNKRGIVSGIDRSKLDETIKVTIDGLADKSAYEFSDVTDDLNSEKKYDLILKIAILIPQKETYNFILKIKDKAGNEGIYSTTLSGAVETGGSLIRGLATYPNPATIGNDIFIRYILSENKLITINVYDVAGRLVRSFDEQGNPGVNIIRWDKGKTKTDETLSVGVYLCQLIIGEEGSRKERMYWRMAISPFPSRKQK